MTRTPPGWPSEVAPPGSSEWLTSATRWLFDQLPGDYRGFEVARRHPILLARLALQATRTEQIALRQLLARIRVDLRDFLTPTSLESAIEMLEKRLASLDSLERQVTLVSEGIERSAASPRP